MRRFTEHQLDIFMPSVRVKPGQRSGRVWRYCCCSRGLTFDWARPGIVRHMAAYRRWAQTTGPDFGFQPVMSLTSSLIAIA